MTYSLILLQQLHRHNFIILIHNADEIQAFGPRGDVDNVVETYMNTLAEDVIHADFLYVAMHGETVCGWIGIHASRVRMGNSWLEVFMNDGTGFDAIEENDSDFAVTCSPNPANEYVYINGTEAVEVQVYNALGQMVKTVQGSNEINVSGLAEGVYLLRITDADGRNHVARVAVKK